MSNPPETSNMGTVTLKPAQETRVVAGHPWIFAGQIAKVSPNVEDGDWIQVRDARRRFLGCGFINRKASLQVRILSPVKGPFQNSLLENKLRAALQFRQRWMPEASSYRWVHSEADGLSGLIVDRYEDTLVMSLSSLGLDQRRDQIVKALQKVTPGLRIHERSDQTFRRNEGLEPRTGWLAGDPAETLEARWNGLIFQTPSEAGHKTGLYLDQQRNHLRMAELLPAGKILDAFTFLGGFALHAAKHGSHAQQRKILGLDQSEEAIRQAHHHLKLNGLEGRCDFQQANVFDWLKEQSRSQEQQGKWDAVILDPPSFTRSRSSLPEALRGYKELHLRSLKLLRPGGLLSTFSCSHHVDRESFLQSILAAAADARMDLKLVEGFQQSPDHPMVPAIPESEYLKGFCFEVYPRA